MIQTNNLPETHYGQSPEVPPLPAAQLVERRVGSKALIHAESMPHVPAPLEGFGHLFPLTLMPTDIAPLILTEASTAEGAERLLNKLEDGPHRDYALRELAIHFTQTGDVEHAYELLHQIEDHATAIHVLSQLVRYEDDHDITTLPPDKLGHELHTLAVQTYDEDPALKAALALREASKALPNDEELRVFATLVAIEHSIGLPSVD